MRISSCWTLATVLLCMSSARAQTTTNNAVASFLSEAYSVYTEVTSILASDAQNTASSTSSSSQSSSTSSLTSSTPSITSMSVGSLSRLTSSATLAGAASTSSAAPSAGHSDGHNILAIVLGSVLGALALGLLLLVLVLICCHRHRKTRSHRALSPVEEEVDNWRGHSGQGLQETGLLGTHATAGRDHSMAAATAATAPDMAEHPAFRNSHENPFVPVPPPPRRTAANSRVGLTDGTVPGQEPFISNNRGRTVAGKGSDSLRPSDSPNHNHHAGEALAAGAGGAALGAAAVHRHNRDHGSDDVSQNRYSSNRRSLTRKPLPDGTYTGDEADAALLNPTSNSTALSPFNSAGHHRSHSQEALLAGGAATGAGALGGLALADEHKNHSPKRDSGFFSDNDRTTPVQRAGTLLTHPIMAASHHQQTTLPPDYEMVPNNENHRRNSQPILGTASVASLGAHQGHREVSPNNNNYNNNNNRSVRNSTPPAVPSRSPRRTRFSDVPYDPANQVPTPPLGAISSIDREGHNSSNSSGDSGFRLSSSIPGGWRRDSAESDHHLRNSGINQYGRRSNTSFTDAGDFATRDSGLGDMVTRPTAGLGARRHSPVINPGTSQGMRRLSQSPRDITSERVRLSDLRAEEEQMERERQRGRRYGGMHSEWAGGDGYDGYESGNHGVGQAL